MIQKNQYKPIFFSLMFFILMFLGSALPSNISALNLSQSKIDSLPNWKWSLTEVVTSWSINATDTFEMYTDNLGNVHLVWSEESNYGASEDDEDIFYSYRDVNTQQWVNPEVVSSTSTEDSLYPCMVVDDDRNVHVAWSDGTDFSVLDTNDYDIFYRRRDSTTNTWGSVELASNVSTDGSSYPEIQIDKSDNIHIVFQDHTANLVGSGTDDDIFHIKRFNNNNSWSSVMLISNRSDGNSDFPQFKIDDMGTLHFVWKDNSNNYQDEPGGIGYPDIIYRKYFPDIDYLTNETVLSWEFTSQWCRIPSMDVDSKGNVYVAWPYYQFDNLAFSYWDSTTSMWTNATIVAPESNDTILSCFIKADNQGRLHLIYTDAHPYIGAGDDWDLYYRRMNFKTHEWSSAWLISTESNDSSTLTPAMDVDKSGQIHIAWRDNCDDFGAGSDYDIFYKTFSGTPETPVLQKIMPNPSESDQIALEWSSAYGAVDYLIFRDTVYISDYASLTPIATVSENYYIDSISTNDTYFYYVIVARNYVGNSEKSNCEYVRNLYSPPSQQPVNTTADNSSTTDGRSSPFFSEFYLVTIGSTALIFSCLVIYRKKRR